MVGSLVKNTVCDSGERLAGIVYGSVQATIFVYHVEGKDCVHFWTHILKRQLEDQEEQLAEFDKTVYTHKTEPIIKYASVALWNYSVGNVSFGRKK